MYKKRRSSIELSNNKSERRCELKASKPVSEQSERASGYIVGFITMEPLGELLVNPQYGISFTSIDKSIQKIFYKIKFSFLCTPIDI